MSKVSNFLLRSASVTQKLPIAFRAEVCLRKFSSFIANTDLYRSILGRYVYSANEPKEQTNVKAEADASQGYRSRDAFTLTAGLSTP